MSNNIELEVKALHTNATAQKEKCEATLAEVKEALSKRDLTKYSINLAQLGEECKEYNKLFAREQYVEIIKSGKPAMVGAIEKFFIESLKPKEEKDKENGTINNVVFETKKSRIDLEDFCDFVGLSKEWIRTSDKLHDLLVLRETDIFKLRPSDLTAKSFYFIRLVESKKNGGTPDSNTKIVSLLQEIVDETLNGDGEKKYKATTMDLRFIDDCITRLDAKEKCSIKTINRRQFVSVVMSVLAHILGEEYKVKSGKSKKSK